MTFEEAKKILEKEGFNLEENPGKPYAISEEFTEFEDPNICEAMQVVSSAGYAIMMVEAAFNARKARLKEELEEYANAPVSGKEKAKEGNPALKESASQFNDALLDEQAKEIKCIKEKNLRLGREIARLKKNMKIEELRKESSRHQSEKIKVSCENLDLEQLLKEKNAILSDVAEELRLSKIREKNLTEVSQKYMKENEELKNELEAFKESYKRRIKEDSEHFEHIQKICNAGLQKWLIESEYLEKDKPFRFSNYDIARGKENKKPRIPAPEDPKYDNSREDFIKKTIDSFNIRAANLGSVGSKYGNGIIDQMIGVDIAEEGADLSGVIVLCGKDFIDALKKVKDVWQE